MPPSLMLSYDPALSFPAWPVPATPSCHTLHPIGCQASHCHCHPDKQSAHTAPASAAAGLVVPPTYKAVNSSNNTFLLQRGVLTQEEAQRACNAQCGHLAAYISAVEQAEVENWYTNQVSDGASAA